MYKNNFISKTTLIRFYKQNPILWNNADPNYRNKVKRSHIKVKLVTIFDGKLPEEFLEICFHSFRTSMIRQIKKSANGNESKCKFYKHFDFLVGSLTEKKNEFESAEIQQLIDIYRENEPLWNNHLKEYSDRNLREVNLRELMEQFEEKFTAVKIKQQWHNLLTNYKRRKQREESLKFSGSGSSEVYTLSWPYFI